MSGPPPGPGRAGRFALTRAHAEALTAGRWHGAVDQVELHGAAIDSRGVAPGCLFACLPGVKVDGHDFAPAAVAAGAGLILASRPLSLPVPVLVVADPAAALGALASEYRRRHQGATWIAVTGSNGKTTTKELLAAACAAGGGAVHATHGNLNNQLGVPLTVLNAPAEIAYAVIELGANHQGEIAALSTIVRPAVGVITNLGPAHLEGFGGLIGVAKGKGELFAALPPGAPALIGLHGVEDNARRAGLSLAELLAPVRAQAAGRRLIEVGGADCPLSGVVENDAVTLRTVEGTARIGLLGAHNLANAMLAFLAAVAAGVAPESALAGLATVRAVGGRLQARALGAHTLIDDTYNANPGSMIAGLDVLAGHSGRRLAVLGAMGELGVESEAGHRLVGAEAARRGLPLITVGARAKPIADGYRAAGGPELEHHEAPATAAGAVIARLGAGPTTVLIKASRSAGLEAVVAAIAADWAR